MRKACLVALVAAALVGIAAPAAAQTAEPKPTGWRAVRFELGGGWGHAFPGVPCVNDCGAGLRPGTGWDVQGFVRYIHVGFGLVHESAKFPWAIDAPSYRAPGASITNRATYLAFRAWLFDATAAFNPYLQVGLGGASYSVDQPQGFCQINPAMAVQGGLGLDVRIVRWVKYNIAWSTRTGTPEVLCDWEKRHMSGVPVPPEKALTAHTITMGASVVLGDGWW